VTVPVSSLIRAALGYFGGSQDLLSITGAVSAAIALDAATSNMAGRREERRDFIISFLFISGKNKQELL
jgi:hypothetical protein